MFSVPAATPLDINFWLFRTHVRVSIWFWLFSAFLGWGLVRNYGAAYLVLWVLCVFLSVLLHEFGHVFMGRIFGSDSHIVLYTFGGLAIGIDVPRWWQRVLVSLAGPGIQLVLWGLLYLFLLFLAEHPENAFGQFLESDSKYAAVVYAGLRMMLRINLWWPVLNLLPIWPLDGGQITHQILRRFIPDRGALVALWISFAVSAGLALHAFIVLTGKHSPFESFILHGGWLGVIVAEVLGSASGQFGLLFFAYLAVGSYFAIQQEKSSHSYHDDDPWHRDRDW